jgi:OOP family OmpA-OmpF porin
MKYQLGVCAAVLLGSISTAALADDPTFGPYVTVTGGLALQRNVTPSGSGDGTALRFDDGYTTTGAFGWGFGNGLRGELELGWHDSAEKSAFSQGALGTPFSISNSGRVTQKTVFANALYDFDTGTKWTPHIGFGLGWDDANVDNVSTLAGGPAFASHGNVFAYQAIAGLEYAVGPGLRLGVEGRYIGTSDLNAISNNAVTGGINETSYSLGSVNILATMRIDFGVAPTPAPAVVPPPPPPVTPPVAPVAKVPEAAREFQVFFDFNKSDITGVAAKIIQAAADTVKAGKFAHLTVTGHTDTVGSAQYNQGLSERRADAVKKQLIADGVPGGEIATLGVGKTGLLVPTKDGVREAQNRRATIDLQ